MPAGRVLIVSDRVSTLQHFRRLWPALPLGYEITSQYAANLTVAQAEKVDAVVLNEELTTPQNAAQAHAAGLAVVTFGCRSRRGIRKLVAAQPDAYEVDNVGKLLRLLGRPAAPATSSR
ncbi:hypothetical protein [Hymenobacter cellulosilyticus]|uniref:Uncharacterized protein n=1 Tax=Hymenobacter cellulosilyticus TaxID=2932248 RepID=A0A8T9Q7T9_9BACT|nr:hypothetical protein [Hymenobacter cellulosilyticus]UOQ72128.1 hypothetical protein MUN79_26775 [Hymenobacter cellulosilyticus]